MTLLSLAPLRRAKPAAESVCDAGDAAARQALAGAGALTSAEPAERGAAPPCGWFDSSWELRQGLAVRELPEAELSVAVLWFAELMPVELPVPWPVQWPELLPASALTGDSAWLQ
jgi:hypothetical protein